MKSVFRLIASFATVVIMSLSIVSCGDDPPEPVDNNHTPSESEEDNNGSSTGSGMSDIVNSNVSFSTTYEDFYFITNIYVDLVPELKSSKRKYEIVHGEPDEEDGWSFDENDGANKMLINTTVHRKDDFEYVTIKSLGACYWLMKSYAHRSRGDYYEANQAMQNVEDFMTFWEERSIILNEIENNKATNDDYARVKELEGYMEEIMWSASYDYVQNYFIVLNGRSYKIGEWLYL